MQSGCSSGYNSMLGTAENPTTSTAQITHPPPKLQILTNNMTQMQLSDLDQPNQPNNVQTHQQQRNSSPLKRQNNVFASPRVQLELQQRRRLHEQRQYYGVNDGMESTEAGPSSQQQVPVGSVNQWLTNQWMQDHHNFQLDLKQFPHTQTSGSMVSGMSNISQMTKFSALSIDTRLSLQTNYDEIYGGQYYASASPLTSGFDATRENIDPSKFTDTLENLLQRIYNINEEPMNRMKALSSMLHRLKDGQIDPYSIDCQFKFYAVYAALNLSSQIGRFINDNQFEYVMQRSLSIIYHLINVHGQADFGLIIQLYNNKLSDQLIQFIKSCFRPERLQFQPILNFGEGIEILILLFDHQSHGSAHIKYAIKYIGIELLMQLSTKSTKKSYLLNCMRYMLRSDGVKDQFIRNLDGISWCLKQLRSDVAEKNLLVVMSIMNHLILRQPQIVQQIVNQYGIQIVAKFLSHGSPNLLYEIGKFLQNIGQQIKTLQFERDHIDEAIKNSLQLFGASDLILVSYLSGFLCNFTTQALPAQIVNEYDGIKLIIHLLKILWYHERINIPIQNRQGIDECIDNLLFILSNLSSDRCDQPLNWNSSRQICSQSQILTVFLDILRDRSVQLYDHRVVLIVNRLLRNIPGLLKDFHNVFDSCEKNPYNFVPTTFQLYEEGFRILINKPENKTMLHRVLELLQLMSQNPYLKASINVIIRSNPNYNLMDLLIHTGTKNFTETVSKVLDLIHQLIVNDLEMLRFWSNFSQIIHQNGFPQRFSNNQQIMSNFMAVENEINGMINYANQGNNGNHGSYENMYY